jgi:hypothetical protein
VTEAATTFISDEAIYKYAMGCSINTYAKKLGKATAEDLASEAYEIFCRRTEGTTKRNHGGYAKRSIPFIIRERAVRGAQVNEKFKSAAKDILIFTENPASEEAGDIRLLKMSRRLEGKGRRAKKVAGIIQFALDNEVTDLSDLAKQFGVSKQAISQGFKFARKFNSGLQRYEEYLAT